jgi:hypothetical protein
MSRFVIVVDQCDLLAVARHSVDHIQRFEDRGSNGVIEALAGVLKVGEL